MEILHSSRGNLRRKRFTSVVALLGLALVALPKESAAAAPWEPAQPAKMSSPISLSLSSPLPGAAATLPGRISELRLEARSHQARTFHGTLRVTVDPWDAVAHTLFELPVTVEPGGTASAQLPLLLRDNGRTIQAELLDGTGSVIATEQINCSGTEGTLTLADIHERSPFAASFSQGQGREYRTTASLVHAQREAASATGDGWILPRTYAGYTHTTAILLDTSTLLKLTTDHANALAEWVERGGTVAFVVSREGDLADEKLKRFIGAHVAETPVTQSTRTRVLSLPAERIDHNPRPQNLQRAETPVPFSVDHLRTDFSGGAAHPSPFGAEIRRGVGSVILLSFDPNEPGVADQAFTRAKFYELLLDAQRRSQVSLSTLAHAESASYATTTLRKALDPNEGFRLGLGFAAVLLCLYGILVGPVLFLRAKRRNTPLAPYVIAPLMSGVTFVAIVATGTLSRGMSGGVRRLTVLEQGSGENTGSEVIYRGFYPPGSTTMRIEGGPPGSFLDLSLSDRDAIAGERMDVAGTGLGTGAPPNRGFSFFDVRTRPWRTFIAREFRTYESKGLIILNNTGSDVIVANQTAQTLRHPFVNVPHQGVYYLGRDIGPGESVRALTGAFVFKPLAGESTSPLREYQLEPLLPESQREHFRNTWGAVGSLRQGGNFWPSDQPVLIGDLDASLDGLTAPREDSGLTVRGSSVLVRVVGREETPWVPTLAPRRNPLPPMADDGKGEAQ